MLDSIPRYSVATFVVRLIRTAGGTTFAAAIALASVQYQQTARILTPVLIIAAGIVTAVSCLAVSELLTMIRDIAINSFDSSDTGLTQLEMESVLTNAIRDTTPRPTDDTAVLARSKAVRSRRVVCSQCGKKIKIPSTSKYKPGDTAKCPGCKSRIVV